MLQKIMSVLFCLIFVGHLQGIDNVWISADVLYWKAYEKSFVLTNKTSPVFTTDDYTKTSVLHPRFNWDPGVRLIIGYRFPDYCWDVALSWTHYHSSFHRKQRTNSNDLTNVNNQQGMFPIWSLSKDIIAGDYVSDAFLRGKLSLDLFDLDVGHPIDFDCLVCFQITPYGGIRGAWIRQRANVKYKGGIFQIGIIAGGIPQNGTDYIHLKNDFWGIGPRIGLGLEYFLGKGVSLYGDMAISGVIGVFDTHQKETYLDRVRSSHDKRHTRCRGIVDLAAGISWQTCLCLEYLFNLSIGWEYHIFFDQLQLRQGNFHLVPHNRNLQVQGVTVNANLEF